MCVVIGNRDIQRCGYRFHSRRMGAIGPYSEEPVPERDARELQQPCHSGWDGVLSLVTVGEMALFF